MGKVRPALAGQANGLLFVAGFGAFAWGLAQWSGPLAATVTGGLVMALAAWPYLRVRPSPARVTELEMQR